MSNIYEISNDIKRLLDAIENEEVSVSDEVIADTFEGLEGELEYKVNNWCRAFKNVKNDYDGLKAEIDRLQERKKAKEREMQRMKSVLYTVLTGLNYDKYKTAEYSLYGFKADKLEITDRSLVPDEFKKERVSYEPDNNKIKETLAKGEKLPFARLVNSLIIR